MKTHIMSSWLFRIGLLVAAILLGTRVPAFGVEVAPRISDREIIESLAELKQGQRDMNQRIDDLRKDVNGRIDDLREDVNGRIDGLQQTVLVLFGAIVTLIVALFGYIAWDRRSMVRPLQERLERFERDIYRDLELQHEEGSRITRLIRALRELAETDEKVAAVLRRFSLL
jgi:predicted PurR-regulated permease PerM